MMVAIVLIILFAIIILIVAIVNGARKARKSSKSETSRPVQPTPMMDMREVILTQISDDFAAMPGWSEWDASIHRANGQYERLGRAVDSSSPIVIEEYDPLTQKASVIGASGNRYTTSYRRCSCPDFRSRRLPCKHMYALAVALDGDVNARIINNEIQEEESS